MRSNESRGTKRKGCRLDEIRLASGPVGDRGESPGDKEGIQKGRIALDCLLGRDAGRRS
jgi:hypothetical protein